MTKPLLSIPTFSHPSGDDGPKKGADEDEATLHLSKYSDHLSNFHVTDEGLDKFAVEINEEDVEIVDPPLSQFLKNNTSHKSKRSIVAYSQIEVATEKTKDLVPTKNLLSEVVQIEPYKRKGKNDSKSLVTITPLHRQANKIRTADVQIRAYQRITNQICLILLQ